MKISGERNLASSQTQCYDDYNKYKSNQEARKMANKENKNVKELNWAVLGTGVIANEMAQALQKMGKSLYAVGNRTHQKAVEFAANMEFQRFMIALTICLKMRIQILFI